MRKWALKSAMGVEGDGWSEMANEQPKELGRSKRQRRPSVRVPRGQDPNGRADALASSSNYYLFQFACGLAQR